MTPAAPTALPGTLTDEEEARAAELEAEIVAQERQAETAQKTARIRSKEATSAAAVARTSSLAISAADEYAYVARDVKRIVLVGGSLVILLFVLWVIAHVTGFGPF